MCLIDKKQFRIAEKDIPIFKVVYKKKYSPICRTLLFHHNETDGLANSSLNNEGHYKFGLGYFHAFTTQECAEEFIHDLRGQMQSNVFENTLSIVTGYIPEGTRYAIDIYNCRNICARKMILNL